MNPLAHSIDDVGARVFGETGAKISRAKVYTLIKANKLIARKMEGRTIILESDLQNFLNELPVFKVDDAASLRASMNARKKSGGDV